MPSGSFFIQTCVILYLRGRTKRYEGGEAEGGEGKEGSGLSAGAKKSSSLVAVRPNCVVIAVVSGAVTNAMRLEKERGFSDDVAGIVYMVSRSTRSRFRSLLSYATMCGPVTRAGISPPLGMPFFGFRFPVLEDLAGLGDEDRGLEKVENGVDAAEPPLSEPRPRIGEPEIGGSTRRIGAHVSGTSRQRIPQCSNDCRGRNSS